MKIMLHEIELNATDHAAGKRFYHELPGIQNDMDQTGLKRLDSGWLGLDVNASVHFLGKVSISFLVDDVDAVMRGLRAKSVVVGDPDDSHLSMRASVLKDTDSHRVEIQSRQTNRYSDSET